MLIKHIWKPRLLKSTIKIFHILVKYKSWVSVLNTDKTEATSAIDQSVLIDMGIDKLLLPNNFFSQL